MTEENEVQILPKHTNSTDTGLEDDSEEAILLLRKRTCVSRFSMWVILSHVARLAQFGLIVVDGTSKLE
jgi:hypothetical protein